MKKQLLAILMLWVLTNHARANTNITSSASSVEDTPPQTSFYKFVIRPHGGIGADKDGLTYYYGGRLLLSADARKKFGLEFSRVHANDIDPYFSLGIVLEQTSFGWLNTTIGTIGYFGYGGDKRNVVGVTTSLGWEPSNWKSRVKPNISYRADFIFGSQFNIVNNLSLGLTIGIL